MATLTKRARLAAVRPAFYRRSTAVSSAALALFEYRASLSPYPYPSSPYTHQTSSSCLQGPPSPDSCIPSTLSSYLHLTSSSCSDCELQVNPKHTHTYTYMYIYIYAPGHRQRSTALRGLAFGNATTAARATTRSLRKRMFTPKERETHA